ncbi:histidine kinase [Acidovorax sp. Leaf76]|uniref:two-component system sensor histidine kinase CreC n=1 Tax=unclassified Acidovorax TaxID=2684926 RepID=UPI0006FAB073|nr:MULTISPECIES: two-component system sensor histidine kinase CreC [unclassified Acidovorax]KQO26345.1 histidine kinase [Acidovorax sp. Leaf76]KQO40107.1 histidine kinase [Acidovorax sp. Leaf84]KQS42256.1 histidine kinase [Acidovorax sp. Leaf191]
MRLGIRLLFAFFLINGIAAFFVLRVFMAEIKPSVREVMEDMMVDTANILAELASEDLAAGRLAGGSGQASPFAQNVRRYASRPVDAAIWGFAKQSLDYRIYVTDRDGRVLFDSENRAVGADYSQWRDVARTLRGEYGARSTREVDSDDTTGVMHVAAPIYVKGEIAGVLTVAKPTRTVQRFIDRAERKVFMGGLLLLALSAAVGVAVTLWMVWNVRRLRDYALSVQGPADGEHHDADAPPTAALAVPQVPGELGDLARAMDRMRARLEGRDYIEGYVRALTHELKSPVAAIRGAGELLQDELPAADRAEFATQVVQQSERLQRIIDRLLELSKLEQRHHAEGRAPVALQACAEAAIGQTRGRAAQRGITLALAGTGGSGPWEAELVTLALTNLLDNAIDFAPEGSTVQVALQGSTVAVQDTGPGVPDYALPRLGERFFTTARPGGERSGSGLGLAIVRRVMALHGGQMVVGNTAPGLRVALEFAPRAPHGLG